MVIQETKALFREKGIELNEEQWEQLNVYYRLLVEWNEKINLTAITEEREVYIKHFYDSISLSFFVDFNKLQYLADIGSGAGFPSFPLKIVFPHLKVTVIDALNKRILFLQEVVNALGLKEVRCLHGRAEDLGRDALLRDSFDLVTARAVARLNVLNEVCLPFVKPGGIFVSMKGMSVEEEMTEAKKSFQALNAELENVNAFELPMEQAKRHFIVVRKKGKTPSKYPRKPGIPFKKPLI